MCMQCVLLFQLCVFVVGVLQIHPLIGLSGKFQKIVKFQLTHILIPKSEIPKKEL